MKIVNTFCQRLELLPGRRSGKNTRYNIALRAFSVFLDHLKPEFVTQNPS